MPTLGLYKNKVFGWANKLRVCKTTIFFALFYFCLPYLKLNSCRSEYCCPKCESEAYSGGGDGQNGYEPTLIFVCANAPPVIFKKKERKLGNLMLFSSFFSFLSGSVFWIRIVFTRIRFSRKNQIRIRPSRKKTGLGSNPQEKTGYGSNPPGKN